MRRVIFAILSAASLAVPFMARASDTLRVDNRLLVAGDSAAQVESLLGKPSRKSHARASRRSGRYGAATGSRERWQYRRDGRLITILLEDDRVASIEEQRAP